MSRIIPNSQNAIVRMLTSAQNGVTPKRAFQKILQMEKYSIIEVCPHHISKIKVIESVGTCEKTVLVCIECDEEIEKPKTEC